MLGDKQVPRGMSKSRSLDMGCATQPHVAVSLLIAAALLFGCTSDPSRAAPSDYTLYEMQSGSIALPFSPLNTDQYLAWLDETHVVFEGFGGLDTKQGSDKSRSSRAIFVWDIHTGHVSRHTNIPVRSSMCFADGFISYAVDKEGSPAFLAGPFGAERETPTPQVIGAKRRHFNRFTCSYYESESLPTPRFGGAIYPLRIEDGWLERVRGGAWMIPKSGLPSKLTVPTLREGSLYPHKYSDFAGTYLYFHSNRSGSETWAFTSKGQMEVLRFPEGPWDSGHVEQVRSGLVLRSKRFGHRSAWDPGHAGLYLSRTAGGTQRLVSGNVYAMRVAKSGCRIAALVDPWDKANRKYRLIAVDVCEKELSHVGQ